MLRELHELSTHFELSGIGYGWVTAHWEIDLSLGFVRLLTTEPKSGKGQPKPGEKRLLPDLSRNGSNPLLIDDAAEYLFGVGSRGEKRQPLYLELLKDCLDKTEDEGVKRVLAYIESCNVEALDRELSELLPPAKDKQGNPKPRDPYWWARERFTFIYEGKPVSDRPLVQEFWRKHYISQQGTEEGTCLLTGETMPVVVKTMPTKIKGIPNTQSSGAAITSFDKSAYESWGWTGNANAPIGFEPAIAFHKMIDILLREERNHYKLGDRAFIFWGDQNAEGLNPEFWEDPAAAVAQSIFTSPEHPEKLPGQRSRSRRFYLGVLKGNKGRIALSSWDEQTPDRIKECVLKFVNCQKIGAGERAKPIWVLRNCAFKDPKKEHTDPVTVALVQGALFGKPLPDRYALKICDRICQEQDVMRNGDRAKALAFYLTLKGLTMNEERPTRERLAYVLGRVAFLMHWAQKTAQNLKKEDTNVSRSLKALSTTPAQMFPRLYCGCITNHLEDRDASGGILFDLKKRMEAEFEQLDGYNPDRDLPVTFDVREQAQFFLGFAICRSEYFKKSEK